MGKKAPAPPDYTAAAEATADSSAQAQRDATYANRVDQTNPFGNVNYESYQDIDPSSGESVTRWRQTETYDPKIQAALDSQPGLQQGRSDLAGGMMGDLQQDYGERMNFDQYGDPIGMDPGQRVGGAGEGISNIGMGGLPDYQRQQLQDQIAGQDLQKNLDYSQAPDVNAPQWTRDAAEKSVYDRGASRLDPQMAQASEALDVRLRSQGLSPGDESYDKQMSNFENQKTDAYAALNAQAMQEGARQAQGMFGMESDYRDQSTGERDRQGNFRNNALMNQFGIGQAQGEFTNNARMGQMGQDLQARLGEGGMRAQFGALNNQAQNQAWNQNMQQTGYNNSLGFQENQLANSLRSQGMDEASQQRAYRLNEVNALMNGQQVNAPNYQGYNQQGTGQGANYMGAADNQYQAQMGQFGANQAGWNSLMGGLGQGAGMFMGSDRRLKTNIAKIGEINGTNWYEFDYFWGDHAIGVMADEVPHAAFMHPSGFLMVDYSKV